MAWMVLPRPMSSARQAPNRWRYRKANQFNPFRWYRRNAVRNWEVLSPLVESEYRVHYPVLTRAVQLRPCRLGEHLGDLAALSLVMPEEWTEAYRLAEPWIEAPPAIVLPSEERDV